METTINLDETHFRIVIDKAKALGTTPVRYLAALIDADARSFDQILDPVRKGFEPMNDDELEGLMDRAVKAARSTLDADERTPPLLRTGPKVYFLEFEPPLPFASILG